MFWELSDAHSKNLVAFDDASGNSYSYNELKEEILNNKESLSSDKKKLAFIFTDNSFSSFFSYLLVLNSGHALALLDDDMEPMLYEDLIEKYKPEIIWKANNKNFKNKNYELRKLNKKVEFYFRIEDPSKDFIHDDTALLLSTSGTTGSPKFVRLSYDNLQSNARSISKYLKLSKQEKAITTLPMHYSFGLSIINSHLYSGSSIVLTDKTILERSFWDLFNIQKCTSFSGVPYTFEMLKRLKFENMNLPSLNSINQAGGSLDSQLIKDFFEISCQKNFSFHIMYGQTEASPRISYLPYKMLPKKVGSIGIAIPEGRLQIVQHGELVKEAGKIGEIVYEGPNVMLGYADQRLDLSNGNDLNGVLHTGDLGYFDEDGYFFITGRLKRMVKIFGQRINLDEVEVMLRNFLGKEVACLGEEDILFIIVESNDEFLNSEVTKKIKNLYHIHHSAIKSFCIESLIYKSSGKKDYKALKMKVKNEAN